MVISDVNSSGTKDDDVFDVSTVSATLAAVLSVTFSCITTALVDEDIAADEDVASVVDVAVTVLVEDADVDVGEEDAVVEVDGMILDEDEVVAVDDDPVVVEVGLTTGRP